MALRVFAGRNLCVRRGLVRGHASVPDPSSVPRQKSRSELLKPFEGPHTATRSKHGVSNSWRQWRRFSDWLKTGQVCVVDGANGTELQRRGGKPAEVWSSGTVAMMRPDLCQEVHEAYLDAGADILITHSYSPNRNVMSASGNGERVNECILASAAIARRATASHVSAHAAAIAHNAASSNASAAQAMAAAATAAARATTSLGTNEGAERALAAAAEALSLASATTFEAEAAARTALACSAAANAAASASRAASEGDMPEGDMSPLAAPPATPISGWDSAGFGPALVVGSLSTHPPEIIGASSANATWPSAEDECSAYLEAAHAHALSGVDMLFLEMMKDEQHAPRAVQAARESGLPVFLGISARNDQETGKTVLFGTGEDAVPLHPRWFHELASILGPSLVGVNVMHTNFSAMSETLRFIREDCQYGGPLGAYPDHGTFSAPDWIFADLDNAEALELIEQWVADYNVQIIGGCCGLGPEYITAVSAFTRRHNKNVRAGTVGTPNSLRRDDSVGGRGHVIRQLDQHEQSTATWRR